jgi:prolyl-tRNA synthetase
MIMTHSDDKGLVLPPRLATTHVVIVPIMANAAAKPKVLEACDQLAEEIRAQAAKAGLPYEIGVLIDKDETKQPGWKFFEHEMLGTPVRIELGPKDLEKNQAVVTRRDEGKKEFLALSGVPERVIAMLTAMQKELLEKARAFREANTFEITSYEEFKTKIEQPGGFFIAPWCQSKECEAKVKEETKATIRCLPLDANYQAMPHSAGCMVCGTTGKSVRAVFARAY